ncbi:FMN-binding negative transcriptional regulator [Streptomyces sp. NPDC018045]|uniref:FMN-binding negative transcriptional regulator n=1 Tax=Streptomyces sp. NPDC018045 TaxID=3365037 RepID=UPI0037A6547A
MFVPCVYREPDRSWMADLIRRNPLALLVSNADVGDGPFATHLPIIQDPQPTDECAVDAPWGQLLGHMNRANPHWAALETGDAVLLAFTGPHAYVSPTIYDKVPAAPTWNFTAVHVRGVVEKISSLEETLDVVKSTVTMYEGELGTGWDMSESLDYFRKIVPGVGAFRITVSKAEGMFKLSQEQEPDVRDRVRDDFARRECGRHRETAQLMSELP